MNICNFTGRLTKDPELKTAQNGNSYLKFCLAVKRRVKNGEHPISDFIDCIAFDKTAEIISKYCKKGSQVGISGRLQTNVYEANGEKHKSSEIVVIELDFLDSKSAESQPAKTESEPTPAAMVTDEPQEIEPTNNIVSGLPFEL